jgi:hypothetical protein
VLVKKTKLVVVERVTVDNWNKAARAGYRSSRTSLGENIKDDDVRRRKENRQDNNELHSSEYRRTEEAEEEKVVEGGPGKAA